MIIYLNPFLRVGLSTVPASGTVRITFPGGRETFLPPPPYPITKDECALESLNDEERNTLEETIRALRPGTERNLPWLRGLPIPEKPAKLEPPAPRPPEPPRPPTVLGPRFAQALAEAHRLHGGQYRKVAAIPYVSHLLAVTALVLEYGGDEDQAIAALLHDAIADAAEKEGGAPALRSHLAALFGARVLFLIEHCTDADTTSKRPWRERKEAHLRRLKDAPADALLIVAAEKLHNLRALVSDLSRFGVEAWSRFRGAREGTLWYLHSSTLIARRRLGGPIATALHRALDELHEVDDRTRPKPATPSAPERRPMKTVKYLNHRLPVQLTSSPGANCVTVQFPGGRKNSIWFRGGYRSPEAPPIQADFPLATLNPNERHQLEALLRLHDPKKIPVLPWTKTYPNN
jgi:hypothetical protein